MEQRNKFLDSNKQKNMIDRIDIRNFKSIAHTNIPLGRINVFIGANGSGKSNILEAVGMAAAIRNHEVTLDSMVQRGVRIARPELMVNSFYGQSTSRSIRIGFHEGDTMVSYNIQRLKSSDIYSPWIVSSDTLYVKEDLLKSVEEEIFRYAIYSPEIDALRGLTSGATLYPLGLHGEGLDVLLGQLAKEDLDVVKNVVKQFVSWVDDMTFDFEGMYKFQGYKLGRSKSDLYFRDSYMQKKNNLFSAENANEGVLVLLFYLALLVSKSTPKFFAIDNIDTGLNPRLCRYLMKVVGQLAEQYDKQLLITTHNPAILDGITLNANGTRLFVVERSDEGDTRINELQMKPATERKMKLSEMWMNGLIGGLPEDF